MALSDLAVRQAKGVGKAYTLADIDGLSVGVSPEGGKSWHFRYYWAGKQKRMSLGTYPEVGLREARGLRDEARALLAKGINPRLHRKQKRHATRLADENTFGVVFKLWVEHRRLSLKEGRQSTLSQILRIFDKDVLPRLGKSSIYEVKRPDLLEVLAKIEQRKAFTTAEKVRTWFNQLFRFALVKVSGLEQNPAWDLDVVAQPKPPVTHNPFLRMGELPALLRTLRGYDGKLQTQLGLRLLLLTGVRTGELRLATPDQFDLDQGLWIIPPEVVKQLQLEMRNEGKQAKDIPPYIVPLSIQAIEIVHHLLEQVRPAQRYLLPHRSDLKKRISENTLNGALRRMGYAEQLTGHGMRATISTALNEIGYPKVWVDAQLSHTDPDKISSAYNHAEYVEQRRRMMQDWADRLDLWEQGQIEAASKHLILHLEGAPAGPAIEANGAPFSISTRPLLLVTQAAQDAPPVPAPVHRLPVVPLPPSVGKRPAGVASEIQRERMAMLAAYEAPHNLPVPVFAQLSGRSRDQINRDIKAGRLLSLSFGRRGQRIPDWQLDPARQDFTQRIMAQARGLDAWQLYRALSEPQDALGGHSPLEAALAGSAEGAMQAVLGVLKLRNELERIAVAQMRTA